MNKKVILFSAIVFLLIIIFPLTRYTVHQLLLCSSGDSNSYYPISLCEAYLFRFRVNHEDLKAIQDGEGLDFILNLSTPKKYQYSDHFISKGIKIDGINNYSLNSLTPLHSSIMYGDLKNVQYLIEKGADLEILTKDGKSTIQLSLEFLSKDRNTQRVAIDKLINERTLKE